VTSTDSSDPLAGLGLGGRGQRADLPVRQGERGTVLGVRDLRLVQGVEVGGRGDGLEGLVLGALDGLGLERLDLYRVEGLVRCGHGIRLYFRYCTRLAACGLFSAGATILTGAGRRAGENARCLGPAGCGVPGITRYAAGI
jgi:hypothetical protein